MSSRPRFPSLPGLRALLALGAVTALAVTLLHVAPQAGAPVAPVVDDEVALTGGGNPVTPGDFRGYGFDQCVAPTQYKMNKWLNKSPYLAVGIYISGDQRFCRDQPNLTPKWVRTQLRKGWKLLPIHLGPQASCQPRFPRWGGESINPRPGKRGNYARARRQGRMEAVAAVEAAQQLGIVPGSTLFYDLEGFDDGNRRCRESAMWFLNAWTYKIHRSGYLSGVYSSAGSGIEQLEKARVNGTYRIPDQIWIARWDGKANTSTTYIPDEGWLPGGRLKQYRGGHNERYGGVTINIDTNWVDLGRGLHARPETHCGGVKVDRPHYRTMKRPATGAKQRPWQIKTLQCFLREAGYKVGKLDGRYDRQTRAAANRWRVDHGFRRGGNWYKKHWVALLSQGNTHAVKFGSAGTDVRRAQRAINAAFPRLGRDIDGRFTRGFAKVVNDYRDLIGRKRSNGIVDRNTWRHLQRGVK